MSGSGNLHSVTIMTTSETLMIRFLAFALLVFPSGLTLSQEQAPSTKPVKLTTQQARDSFKKLGINRNAAIPESSGLAISSVKDAVWTINDSGKGDKASLLLLHQNGKLLFQVFVDAKNIDWEAMSRAVIDEQPWLVIADVGDNLQRRLKYQLYLTPEPVFPKANASRLEDRQQRNVASTTRVDFAFSSAGSHLDDLEVLNKKPEQKNRIKNSKPINCEAAAVDPLTNDIWFVEKIYINSNQKTAPGIFALTLPKSIVKPGDGSSPETPQAAKIQMAERIGDFPVRNVTGMAFSPDGNKLLVRNYFGAHLYRRREKESWRQTIKLTKPIKVAIPLQRQGEAVCFTPDSNAIILTSEVVNQPIWRVGLTDYFALPLRLRDTSAKRTSR